MRGPEGGAVPTCAVFIGTHQREEARVGRHVVGKVRGAGDVGAEPSSLELLQLNVMSAELPPQVTGRDGHLAVPQDSNELVYGEPA